MAEWRQHKNDEVNRTVIVDNLAGRTISASVWTATPAGLTIGTPTKVDNTYSCFLGTATTAQEYTVLAQVELDSGEKVTRKVVVEVWE